MALGRDLAEATNVPRRHLGVRLHAERPEALELALAGANHARAHGGRALGQRSGLELFGRQRRKLDVQVDAVQEGARDAAQVSLTLGRGAQAAVEGRAAAAARIGRADQLEAGGEVADPGRPRDAHPSVFQRLAQRLQHVLLELW